MKTFRLYSLSLLEKEDGKVVHKPVPIAEGLIINLENQDQIWYIDAVISKENKIHFENMRKENQNFLVDVVITSKENHPAAMIASVSAITELSDNTSILMEAKLALRKDDIIEDMVENLVEEGFSGAELFSEFKKRKENLADHSQRTLDEVYTSLKESGKYELS